MQGREKKLQIKCEELLRERGKANKSGAENHVITKSHGRPSSKIVPFGSLHLEKVIAEEKVQRREWQSRTGLFRLLEMGQLRLSVCGIVED